MGFPDITTDRLAQTNLVYAEAANIAHAIETSPSYARTAVTEQYLSETYTQTMGQDVRQSLFEGMACNRAYDGLALADIAKGLHATPDIAEYFRGLVHDLRGDDPALISSFEQAIHPSHEAETGNAALAHAGANGHRQGVSGPIQAFAGGGNMPEALVAKGVSMGVKKGAEQLAKRSVVAEAAPWVARALGVGAGAVSGAAEVVGAGLLAYGIYNLAKDWGVLPWQHDEASPSDLNLTKHDTDAAPWMRPEVQVPLTDKTPMTIEPPLHPGAATTHAERRAIHYWHEQHTPFYKTADQLANPNYEYFSQPAPPQTQAQREAALVMPRAQSGDASGPGQTAGSGIQIATSQDDTPDVEYEWDGDGPINEAGFAGNVNPRPPGLASEFRQAGNYVPQGTDLNGRGDFAGHTLLNHSMRAASPDGRVYQVKNFKITAKFVMPGVLDIYVAPPEPKVVVVDGKEYQAYLRRIQGFRRAGNANHSSSKEQAEHFRPFVEGMPGMPQGAMVPKLTWNTIMVGDLLCLEKDCALPPKELEALKNLPLTQWPEEMNEALQQALSGYNTAGAFTISPLYMLSSGQLSKDGINAALDQQLTTMFGRQSFIPVTSGYGNITYHNSVKSHGNRPYLFVMGKVIGAVPNHKNPSAGSTAADLHGYVLAWQPGQAPVLAAEATMRATSLRAQPPNDKGELQPPIPARLLNYVPPDAAGRAPSAVPANENRPKTQ